MSVDKRKDVFEVQWVKTGQYEVEEKQMEDIILDNTTMNVTKR